MKILMMHRHDGRSGGAQIQMNRLRERLLACGHDARILCRESRDPANVVMPYRPRLERCVGAFTRRLGLNDIHLLSSGRVTRIPEVRDADVIDLHCLHSGTFSYLALPALSAAKPLVFTFHDMWPFTGHCHASLGCGRWKSGCGSCPHLEVEPSVRRDATAWEWSLKKRSYEGSRFSIVTPSRWLHDRVAESMLAGFPVRHIPHGLDLEVFRPLDRDACRAMLGLPSQGPVIMCAMENMERPLKGGVHLPMVIESLPSSVRRDATFLFMGRSLPSVVCDLPVRVRDLGYVADDRLKAVAYSAADLLINPSLAESFGLVALESIACGTPVAAFRVGGIPEIIRPGITGELAEPNDPGDLAAQITRILDRQAAMRVNCRKIAEEEYSVNLQAERYLETYQAAINAWN